ncbi:MAG: Flp family type IVb pilin [Pseudomonadota bacterium]
MTPKARSCVVGGVHRFLKDDRGLTAMEYGILGAIIAAALVVLVPVLPTALQGAFQRMGAHVDSVG